MCLLVATPLALPEAKPQAVLESDPSDSLTSSALSFSVSLNHEMDSLLHGSKSRQSHAFQRVINTARVFLIMV